MTGSQTSRGPQGNSARKRVISLGQLAALAVDDHLQTKTGGNSHDAIFRLP